jgi:hypothetical protein
MSDNPHGLVDLGVPKTAPAKMIAGTSQVFASSKKFAGTSGEFAERNQVVMLAAVNASKCVSGKDAHWAVITGLGYNGKAVSAFPVTAKTRATAAVIAAESPCLNYRIHFETPGDWQFTVRALPTFSVETGQPQRYAISLDDAPPKIVALPRTDSEDDPVWQENVLRNAALTTTTLAVHDSGVHTLKIWMVDPGLVLDAIIAERKPVESLKYLWPGDADIN